MRSLILKIHLVAALIAGAFMVLLGITGSILAWEPEIDDLLHPELSHVTAGSRVLSLVEIGDAVSRRFGGEPIVAYLPASSPQVPAQVILSRGIVSVNQYTGEVLGVRTRGRTFLGVVRALHVQLALGDAGRNFQRWSAVAMLISLGSGLYLWWPVKRMRIRAPRWSAGFWFDVHNAIGILLLAPLLVLAATGTVIGFEDQAASLLDRLIGSTPQHTSQSLARPEPNPGAREITPDQAVAIASSQLPGAVPYRVQMPRYGGRYIVALDTQKRVGAGNNTVSIDPWSGKILSQSLATDQTARQRLMTMNEAIHTGSILGTPSRIIVALAGIFLPVQALSGLMMWLRRRRSARSN